MQKQYRQGDVLLVEIEESEFVTDGLQVRQDRTVALGEATGHHHTFEDGAVVYEEPGNLAVNDKGMFVEVTSDSVLTHQEHAPVLVPRGKYRRIVEREYSPEAIRNIQD